MPIVGNLVHQTSLSTGTGALGLDTVDGKQTLAAVFGSGATTNVFPYFISSRNFADWEVGHGHVNASGQLVRDTVKNSSNSNALVDFRSGPKDITNAVPAEVFNSQGVNVLMYGVKGDGIADDTAALLRAFNNSPDVFVPEGDYLHDDIAITNSVRVSCHRNAVFRRRSAVAGESNLIKFAPGSEMSEWNGGTINGNRDAITYASGVWAEFRVATHNVTVKGLRIEDAAYHGLFAFIDNDTPMEGLVLRDIVTENCTTNQTTNLLNPTIDGFHAIDPDNGERAVDVRGLAINTVNGGFVDRILVEGMTGDDQVPSSTDTVTGILGLDLFNVQIGTMAVRDSAGELDHLCISLARFNDCSIRRLESERFAGIGIELVDGDGSVIQSVFADAHYHKNANSAANASTGVIVHGTWVYPLGHRERRYLKSRQRLQIMSGLAQRCGIGLHVRAPGVRYNNILCRANLLQGFRQAKVAQTTHFGTGAPDVVPRDIIYQNCEALFNGSAGLQFREGSCYIIGGRYANNGTDSTNASANRAGIGYLSGGSGTVERISVPSAPVLEDTQTGQYTDAATYKPGTSAQIWSENGDYYIWTITLLQPDRFQLGQVITLKDAGGAGTDRTGTIVDINADEAVVSFGSAVSINSSGNTTALTGTWSGSGTLLTGSGGAALTEVPGPVWVTDGTEWRQVEDVDSDNSLLISAAFTTPLSGTTLSKLTVDVYEVQTQQFGAHLGSANITAVDAIGWVGSGNVSALTSINVATARTGIRNLRTGKIASHNFTIADDAATSYTPASNSGGIVIVDDTNTMAQIVYRATASPLCAVASGSATVAATTGALAGTTGTDNFLTVSTHTDGKIYLENRRGAQRTFSVLEISRD